MTQVLSSGVTNAADETTETGRAARHHSDTPTAGIGQRETAFGPGHRRELETLIRRRGLSNLMRLAVGPTRIGQLNKPLTGRVSHIGKGTFC